ncbi:MAG: HAMP domain-containing sensor histidine kinase [Synechococcales bacterium]|nr:HAMP domain-containing sensor histidine kinase [Synechococcales bacterium]
MREVAHNFYGNAAIAEQWREGVIVYSVGTLLLLLMYWFALRTTWGKRHLKALFLLFACSIGNLFAQIIFTFYGVADPPGLLIFLAITVLIPVHWRLHLTYQFLSIAYYAIAYPLIGLSKFENELYSLYSRNITLEIIFVCSISLVSVYLYERLKRSEFEAHRQLQMFLHSVSHDLQTPVVGTAVVLRSMLDKSSPSSGDEIRVQRSQLERLLQGSDRQLTLIHSLLEAHTIEVKGVVLDRQPIQLKPLVDSVLSDLSHVLAKKHIQLVNYITADLPLVNADANQLWRVFSNLIGNALKHNPHRIQLTLDAKVVEMEKYESSRRRRGVEPSIQTTLPALLCTVQDNGIGIAPEQGQRLFELYARGAKARYMPGLGLGLYLCKQIIEAHGGEMGLTSQPGEGATFWFTLPLHPA